MPITESKFIPKTLELSQLLKYVPIIHSDALNTLFNGLENLWSWSNSKTLKKWVISLGSAGSQTDCLSNSGSYIAGL
jgi:hypothetical protein